MGLTEQADNGRFILGSNASNSHGPSGVFGTLETYAGPVGQNPFIRINGDVPAATPYIPDLAGGAEVAGLLAGIDALADDFQAIRELADDEALAVFYRPEDGVAGYDDDYVGYDLVLLINLTDQPLDNPTMGVGFDEPDPASLENLFQGGYMNQTWQPLTSLEAYGVYATLVPESIDRFSLAADGCHTLGGVSVGMGEFVALTAVPEPATLILLILGFTWIVGRRRHGRR